VSAPVGMWDGIVRTTESELVRAQTPRAEIVFDGARGVRYVPMDGTDNVVPQTTVTMTAAATAPKRGKPPRRARASPKRRR